MDANERRLEDAPTVSWEKAKEISRWAEGVQYALHLRSGATMGGNLDLLNLDAALTAVRSLARTVDVLEKLDRAGL